MAVGMTAAVVEIGHRGSGRTPYLLDLGRRMRSAREALGLSPDDVQEVSKGKWKAPVVTSYERGDRRISPEKLIGIAAFYRVPPGWLLTGEGPVSADGQDIPAGWRTSLPSVTQAFTAITGAARSGVTEQIRQQLLDEAEDSRYDDASVRVIVRMAELVGGAM